MALVALHYVYSFVDDVMFSPVELWCSLAGNASMI